MKFKTLILILSFTMATLGFADHTAIAQTASQQGGSLFTGKDAADTIADALTKSGAGEDIKVSVSEARDDDVIASASGTITATPDNLEFDKAHNHWQAIFLLKADGKNLAPIKLSGHYDEMTSIPVLKRHIQAGEVISENDIDMDKQPSSHLHENIITDSHDLIGKSPKHMISQGRPIRADEIGSPAVLSKGAHVTLYYKSPNIEIKTFGEALDAGAVGDVIRVRNITSKTIVQGTVESSDRVRVTAPETNSAEAM